MGGKWVICWLGMSGLLPTRLIDLPTLVLEIVGSFLSVEGTSVGGSHYGGFSNSTSAWSA